MLYCNDTHGGTDERECFGNNHRRGPWRVERRLRHRRGHRRNPRRRGGPRRVPVVEATYPASAQVTEEVIRTSRRSTAVFVTHELLRRGAVEERADQVNIAPACLERSTLVVLPTGMTKNEIAAIVIRQDVLQRNGRNIFIAAAQTLLE